MENILLLDTSVGTFNKGDEIIMECVKEELHFILENNFVINLPTHVSSFSPYQIFRNSSALNVYKKCKLKFVGGTNLLVPNLLTHYPQWNINKFNYQAILDCILVGVGKGAGDKTNNYTKKLYTKMLNKNFYHSTRDERTKKYLESMGFKAINTGCATMWKLTPEFCKTIPQEKSDNVAFTLTASSVKDDKDQMLIDTLINNYNNVYFWPQGIDDYDYLQNFSNISSIKILQSTIEDYKQVLSQDNIEYVGTRLHGGIYAMRHKKRSIILVIDERAREINKTNNLNCLEKTNIGKLNDMINSNIVTNITMPLDNINRWKLQFSIE